MNISSMTGFSRQNAELKTALATYTYSLEVKSVNAKGLDIKLKLPPLFEECEPELKAKIAAKFTRGTLNVVLNLQNETQNASIKINEALLETVQNKVCNIYLNNKNVFSKPSPAELLNICGVVTKTEETIDEKTLKILQDAILKSFDESLEKLYQTRLQEGQKIEKALLDILKKIEAKTKCAEKITSNIHQIIREKVTAEVKEYLENTAISPERLEQEILFYVMRADTKEEIDRLKAHIVTAYELFKSGGAVGRRLDFLCQELNREANTLCSKSMDLELTKTGLDIKALIEQFREQVQNLE